MISPRSEKKLLSIVFIKKNALKNRDLREFFKKKSMNSYFFAWGNPSSRPDLAPSTEIGRENTGDVNINLKDSLKNIYMELLVIPETKKTDVLFLRVIEKGGLRSWLYSRQNFKTASKQQLIKETQSQYVDDERLADYLDELIFKMQNNFSKVFDLKGKNFNNIDLLYDIIPKDDEIDLFSLSFEKIKNFHIQTRN